MPTRPPVTRSAALKSALRMRRLRVENARLRTQLQEVRCELDACRHALSHDLRAPLQAIDGFSGVLESLHAKSLDEKGMHYVRRIRAGAGRMTELIEGLEFALDRAQAQVRPRGSRSA